MSSDDKNKTDADAIVVTDATGPEVISDQDIDQVEGGYLKITMTNLNTNMLSPSIDAETITASSADDLISSDMLRKRPGRMK